MRIALRLALPLFLVTQLPAPVSAQGFEEMIEDTLRRLQGGEASPEEPLPQPFDPSIPAPPGAPPNVPAPGAAPDGGLVPVEPGPRAYTPPKVPKPATAQPSASSSEPSEPPESVEAETPAPLAEPTPPATDAASAPENAAAAEGTAAPAEGGASPAETIPAPLATDGAPSGTDAASPVAERTRESLTPDEVNATVFPGEPGEIRGASPLILKAQVMLDRAGASPGAIDAYPGANLNKAVAAVEAVLSLPVDGTLDRAVWDALGGDGAPPILVRYTISADDLSYPFVPSIPTDFAEQAALPSLGYAGPGEMFSERFHMDFKLLRALNPDADFSKPGTQIWVTDVSGPPITVKVARIVVDKRLRQVRAYDAADHMVVAYPATIGSPDNPSPTGEHIVKAVAENPVYYYDPANFVQGDNVEKLQLPPGPNNPVGSVWIDLSDPGYGIHGTPEPTRIDKTGSHGCVRLTNWDAEELASLVEAGVTVSFAE